MNTNSGYKVTPFCANCIHSIIIFGVYTCNINNDYPREYFENEKLERRAIRKYTEKNKCDEYGTCDKHSLN